MSAETRDSDTMVYDGPLALAGNAMLDGWYAIEKAEHEGRRGWETVGPHHRRYWCSERISDADVEGPLSHMRGIAEAIREGGTFEEYRCAVRCEGDRVYLWSPRNSMREAEVPRSRALELAAVIENAAEEATDGER